MNILDKYVIPNSGANLGLLQWLLLFALIIFSVYSAVLFGSSVLSYIYYYKFRRSGNLKHILLSKNYIDLITPNKTMAFGLGFIPFLAIILLYTQLLHESNTVVVHYLIYSFILYLIALIILYVYKYRIDRNADGVVHVISLSWLYGSIGILILCVSLFIFLASVTLAIDVSKWNLTSLDFMLSLESINRLFQSFVFSIGLTCITYIVKYFIWDTPTDSIETGFLDFSKNINLKLAFYFSIFQPVFIFINLFTSPQYIFTPIIFGIIALAFFILPIVLYLIHYQLKENSLKGATWSFYILILVFGLIITKDQFAFDLSARKQVQLLTEAYDKKEAETPSKFVVQQKNNEGEEIYQSKCTACHKFDQRLVGPPHKEVMLKYQNDREAMVKFILNPVKVNPDYPEMPNQGLKPKEAEAVVKYMYEHFKLN